MRLLDRYLLREFATPFAYCFSAFFLFWVSFDLITQLDRFQRLKLSASDIAHYYLIKIPDQLTVVLPVALLLALLYALSHHSRYNELTAMRAAGISLWRLALPYFAVGLLLTILMFAANELWLPDSLTAAERLLSGSHRGKGKGNWERNLGFSDGQRNRRWFIEAYNLQTYEMIRPRIEWTLVTGTRREISAERGYWQDGTWVLTNVQELVYPPVRGALPGPPIETNLMTLDVSETPQEIAAEVKIGRINSESLRQVRKAQFSIREILDYKTRHPDGNDKSRVLDAKLHGRIAGPWTCFVVVLIALPFGVASARRNVFVGVASSIVICFTYFVLVQVALALGIRGVLTPWLAAWGPNLIFGGIGTFLAWKIR
ncbi:MAG: LptF/LptG family permease [Verrucomicrobia subdivision 3 bacterium]|nr:LptF/LptG family permease [Limisphaerales bacterium]